jgi:Fe-S-cluster containining protein
MPQPHPCLSCGACCATFRVLFYWRETEKSGAAHPVPLELTEDTDDFRKCMKGTNQKNQIQCVALKGRIGKYVGCQIYENRPSTCRAFAASYENGKPNKKCDLARAAHGLKPLRPCDWEKTPETRVYSPIGINNPLTD